MNVRDSVDFGICCGCGACVNSCPVNAIKFSCDEADWHLHPDVDTQLCVNCGKCLRVCPALKEKNKSNFEPYGYAAVAKNDIRRKSSSGGIFFVLASYVLSKKGYVAGAVYDENLRVKHIVSSNPADLERMRGSKYVQSDASQVYSAVCELLLSGKTVLFSGTPCQIAAMKTLVGGDDPNLICVDILCHGVPSPKIFDYYLNENFDKSQIETVLFRNKEHRNGMPGSLTVVMKNGDRYYSEYFDNSYYDAFGKDISLRDSCFDCKYAEFPRVGDISVGDFWGAKTTATKIDYEKGSSITIVNSKKGEKLWNAISKKLDIVEKYPLEVLMSWNRNKRQRSAHPRRGEFLDSIKRHNSLRVATSNIVNNRYDVGVFGVTMNPNFGGLVTYWALYKAISELGYKTAIIEKPLFDKYDTEITHAHEFFRKRCNIAGTTNPADLPKLSSQIDRFVIGSDQVWNYNLFGCWKNSLYLDFVSDDNLKIAYAASFGHSEHAIPSNKISSVSNLFKRFDYIGVREADGVEILRKNYGVQAKHVMDPVFLVNTDDYRALAADSSLVGTVASEFVGSYIIEPNDFKLGVVKEIADKLGADNLNFTDGDRKHFVRKSAWFKDRNMHIQHEATLYDWLYMLQNAKFVVTDSFHAVCFCIMFKKPFILLQERWALSRIESIMNIFGLHERWLQISDKKDFVINEAWFAPLSNDTDLILLREKVDSLNWLSSALESRKQVRPIKSFTAHIDKTRVEDYFYFLLRKRQDYVITVSSCNFDSEIFDRIDFKCKLSFQDFATESGKAFVMLYDFDKDFLVYKNSDYSEINYDMGCKNLSCMVDKAENSRFNSIYVGKERRSFSNLSTTAGVVISVYSKSIGEFVDSFEVVLNNGVAEIKR